MTLPKRGGSPKGVTLMSVALWLFLAASAGGLHAEASNGEVSLSGPPAGRRLSLNFPRSDEKWALPILPDYVWTYFLDKQLEISTDKIKKTENSSVKLLSRDPSVDSLLNLARLIFDFAKRGKSFFTCSYPVAFDFFVKADPASMAEDELFNALSLTTKLEALKKNNPGFEWKMDYAYKGRLHFKCKKPEKTRYHYLSPAIREKLINTCSENLKLESFDFDPTVLPEDTGYSICDDDRGFSTCDTSDNSRDDSKRLVTYGAHPNYFIVDIRNKVVWDEFTVKEKEKLPETISKKKRAIRGGGVQYLFEKLNDDELGGFVSLSGVPSMTSVAALGAA
eukprot:GHVT01096392.1.p1 GENE.GHVT01096392.1~~GHVT01096392.1.p1  ORF type:complete len:336 (-),score=35.65 GHVT01096392.1:108-1115(-)